MATIPQNMRPYIKALKQDPTAWAALRAANPNVNQLRGLVQGLENHFETPANKLAIKAAMEAEAGISITNSLAKKVGRIWMQLKWGNE